MAEGPKNRDSGHAGMLLGESGLRREAFATLTNNGQGDFARVLIAFAKEGVDAFAQLDLVRGDEDVSWTLDLAEQMSKNTRGGFGLALPYFLCDSGCKTKPLVNEIKPLTKFQDFLPYESVDIHTRPGSAAMSATCKKLSLDGGGRWLGEVAFYCEGWLLRDMASSVFPYWKLYLHLRDELKFCSPRQAEQFYTDIKPVLDDCRAWALTKTVGTSVDDMRRAYLDNWIE